MKRLLSILLLLPAIAFGQAQEDSTTVSPGEYTCLGLRHDSAFDFTSGKPVFIIAGVKKICAGSHSYLLIMADGSIKGWGPNDAGELGLGNTTGVSTPTTATVDNLGNTLPAMVDGGMSANLNAPYWQSWMISAAGDLYVAGCTLGGGLGDNTTGASTTTRFTKVTFPGGATIVKAQTGRFMMAMDNIGRVWTWGGYNDVYVLAQGASPANYKVPTQISFGGETATDIAGGSNTNYIISTVHHYWSWTYANQTDYNATGTFSGGTFTPGANPTVPENITTTLNFPATVWKIAVNNESSYAILADSSLWGWGGNANGTIGDGNENNYYTYKCCPGPNSGSPAPFAWGQDFHDLQVFKPKRIGQGIKFKSIFVTNALDYTSYFLDQYNFLYACGRDKQAICHGITPGNVTQGDQQAYLPNSWDHPYLAKIFPFRVATVYQSPSPYCVLNPTSVHCTHYTIPAHSNPTIVYFGSAVGRYIVLNASGSSDTRVIAYCIHKQTSGTALAMGAPDQMIDTLKMTTAGAPIPDGSYSFEATLINDNWDSTKGTITVVMGASSCNCSYFFASSGSDANVGTDSLHPFATMAKLNTLDSDTSASFYRNRGDVWTEAIRNFAGKRLDAYGNGPGPMSNGFVTLTSPTSLGGGVYQYTCAGCYAKTNMLLMNGVQQPLARFPNTGYLTYQSGVGTTSITSSSLTGTPNWTGGLLAKRHNSSTVITDLITGQSGGTLTYAATTIVGVSPNFGFFILNDSLALDTLGEYTTTAPGFIKMFFGAASPGSYTVKVAAIDTLIGIAPGAKNVTIVNQNLQGANICGICMVNDTNVVADRDTIQYSGGLGYYAYAAVNSGITNSLVQYCNDNGIMIGSGSKHHVVAYDSVFSIGMMLGQGKTLPQDNYKGLTNDSWLGIIRYNRVAFTGYDGIMGYQYDSVDHNIVHDFCKWINDGAGIYSLATGGSSDTLRKKYMGDNIAYNGVGDSLGTNNNTYVPIYAYYFDQNNTNTDFLRNTADSIKQAGLFIHNSRTLTIRDNTINNCKYAVLAQGDNLTYLIRGITFKKNTLAVKTAAQQLIAFVVFNNAQFTSAFGGLDSNAYCFNNLISKPFFVYPSTNMTYSQWQDSSADTHGRQISVPVLFGYNTSGSAATIPLAGNYVDGFNKLFQTSATLPPWQSLMLVNANMISATRGRRKVFH